MKAIRGVVKESGTKVSYSGPLTEIFLLGGLANRFQKRVEYDPRSLFFSDASLNPHIKGPVNPSWDYGVRSI